MVFTCRGRESWAGGGKYEGCRVGCCGAGNGREWELGRGWAKTTLPMYVQRDFNTCKTHLYTPARHMGQDVSSSFY